MKQKKKRKIVKTASVSIRLRASISYFFISRFLDTKTQNQKIKQRRLLPKSTQSS